jgi:hypothetical protein
VQNLRCLEQLLGVTKYAFIVIADILVKCVYRCQRAALMYASVLQLASDHGKQHVIVCSAAWGRPRLRWTDKPACLCGQATSSNMAVCLFIKGDQMAMGAVDALVQWLHPAADSVIRRCGSCLWVST